MSRRLLCAVVLSTCFKVGQVARKRRREKATADNSNASGEDKNALADGDTEATAKALAEKEKLEFISQLKYEETGSRLASTHIHIAYSGLAFTFCLSVFCGAIVASAGLWCASPALSPHCMRHCAAALDPMSVCGAAVPSQARILCHDRLLDVLIQVDRIHREQATGGYL